MKHLVSILIPAYNAEKWIADTIQAALAQTWPNKEIIVVDDGSQDHTLQIARSFTERSIKVVTQENQGAASARNKAYSLCQGEYIQWLDADDLLSSDKIISQMGEAERHGPDSLLSSGWAYFMYRPAGARFISTPLWEDLTPVEWLLRKMGQCLHMQTATWLVSRKLSQAAGPWDTRLSLDDDGEYFCRVVMASQRIHFVPQAKVFYRMSGYHSLSKVHGSQKKLESLLLSMRLHVGYLLSLQDSPRTRSACLSYLRNWLPYFHPNFPQMVDQIEGLARGLGGQVTPPPLPWKYAWMEKLLGYKKARRAQYLFPTIKAHLMRHWDKILYRLEKNQQNTDYVCQDSARVIRSSKS